MKIYLYGNMAHAFFIMARVLLILHQENNTFLGWLEMLESTRVARNTRSSFEILKKIL